MIFYSLATWLCQFADILRFELSLTFTRLTNAEAETRRVALVWPYYNLVPSGPYVIQKLLRGRESWEIWVMRVFCFNTNQFKFRFSIARVSFLRRLLCFLLRFLWSFLARMCSQPHLGRTHRNSMKFLWSGYEVDMKWIWSGKKHNGKEWHCKPCHLRDLPPNIKLHTLWDRKFSYSRSLSTSFSVFFQDCFAFLQELGSKHGGSASDLYFKDVCALRMISVDHRNKHLVFTHPVKFLNISLIIFHVCYIRVFPTNGCFLAYSCVVLLNIVEYYPSEKLMSLLQTKVSAIKHKLRSPRLSHIIGDHRHTSTVPFLASWLQNKECKSKDLVHQVDEVRHISKMDIPQCSKTIRCISYLLAHVSFRRGKTTTYNTSIVAMSANAESWSKINGKWLTALRMRWSSPPGIVS